MRESDIYITGIVIIVMIIFLHICRLIDVLTANKVVSNDIQMKLREKPQLATAEEKRKCRKSNQKLIILIFGIFISLGIIAYLWGISEEDYWGIKYGEVWIGISVLTMIIFLLDNAWRFSEKRNVYKILSYCSYQSFGVHTGQQQYYSYRRNVNCKFIYYDWLKFENQVFCTLPNSLMWKKEMEHSDYIYLYGVERGNKIKIFYETEIKKIFSIDDTE